VVFSHSFAGERLRFTTNGSAPTLENSKELNGPLFIGHSSVIRVSAFRESALPGGVQTFTFLLAQDVLRQTGFGYPPDWGLTNGVPVRAQYAMEAILF
jgi:hypothetical protein